MTKETKDILMDYYFGPYRMDSAKVVTINPSEVDISAELEKLKKYYEEDVKNTMTLYNEMYKGPAVKNIKIEKVIFNPPATIVFWSDGEKTVVKAHDEAFDPEKGLAMAFCKHCMGDKFKATFKKYNEQWEHQIRKTMIEDEMHLMTPSYSKLDVTPLIEKVNSIFGVSSTSVVKKFSIDFRDKIPTEKMVLRRWCEHHNIFVPLDLFYYLEEHPYTEANKKLYYKNIGLTRYKTLCKAAGRYNEAI